MVPWQDRAAAKRAQLHASIPSAWLLPASTLAAPPSDVRSIPRSSGILSELELKITEEDNAAVILEKIRSREWSSEQVTLAFCKRAAIAQQLTCCLTEILFDRALKRAKELDEHLETTGEVVGPLHGLPVSLKEQFDIEGVESTMGFVSRIGHNSSSSAVLVSLLESLGAIPHCRTNIPQTLLSDESTNNVFGRTLNPSNTSLTAGGSSGGEAALLAMRGSPLGVGTDLGGSIRKPASFTGLYSLRPTSRRLPYAGASNIFAGAEALESVLGPMANSLESLEVFMKAVVGAKPWEWDSRVIEREWKEQEEEGRKCFAIMRWDGLVRCHPPIERALDEVTEALRKAGHEVVDWEPLDHAGAQEIVSKIFDSDGGEDVKQWLGDSGEPIMPQVFTSQHPAMSAHESWQLNKKRDEYRQLFLKTWLATATSTQTGRPIDAIICATAPHLAAPHLESPRPGGLITYTTVWSLLDLPCYTFPVGVVDEQKDPQPLAGAYTPVSEVDKENWEGYSPELYKNAPVVLQVINPRRFREDELLGLGGDIEKALGR
ncbi:amidase signature domain-containing protein [Leucosporidium creatinivorum]|uniref:amidase n=1 Tax=Leucosporidium creatinivorum TaxID=106004 RepID=A0A1Y2G0Y8_9BASI|nr:amidase signature domain-containing protein [Leucosporidium creatinivorum]